MSKKANVPAKTNEAAGAVVAFDPTKMQIKRRLVVPTISIKAMKEGDKIYFRAEEAAPRQVTQIDEKTGEVKEKNGAPDLLPVLQVTRIHDDGTVAEFGQLVIPAIPYRALKDEGDLSGRMFAMQKGRSLGVNKANVWEVVEIGE